MLKLHCERSPPCSPRRIQSARYARVSRVTPDKLLARLLTRIPTTAEPTTLSEWSIMILYQKACKPADVNPRRQQMISILEKKAEALEKTVTEPRLVARSNDERAAGPVRTFSSPPRPCGQPLSLSLSREPP